MGNSNRPDDLLRQKLTGHVTPPPPEVWAGVAASAGIGGAAGTAKFLTLKKLLLAVALPVAALSGVGYWIYQTHETPHELAANNETQVTAAENSPNTQMETASPFTPADVDHQERSSTEKKNFVSDQGTASSNNQESLVQSAPNYLLADAAKMEDQLDHDPNAIPKSSNQASNMGSNAVSKSKTNGVMNKQSMFSQPVEKGRSNKAASRDLAARNVTVSKKGDTDPPARSPFSRTAIALEEHGNAMIDQQEPSLTAGPGLSMDHIIDFKKHQLNTRKLPGVAPSITVAERLQIKINPPAMLDEIEYTYIPPKVVHYPKVYIGVAMQVYNAGMINQNTYGQFDTTRLAYSTTIRSSYGIMAGYRFKNGLALETGFFPSAKIGQTYKDNIIVVGSEGKYQEVKREVTVRYHQVPLTLHYQTLWLSAYPKRTIIQDYFAGIQYGYLKSATDVVNGTATDISERLQTHDVGFIGGFNYQLYLTDHILLSTGIQGGISFTDNNAAGWPVNASYTKSHHWQLGGKLGLIYTIE